MALAPKLALEVMRKFGLFMQLGLLCSVHPVAAQNSAVSQHPSVRWDGRHVPFSFIYGETNSHRLLRKWTAKATVRNNADGAITDTSFRDPKTSLTVTVEVRTFRRFPGASDWLIFFRNDSRADTPVLDAILPLDLVVKAPARAALVHHARGSSAEASDFAPEDLLVGKNRPVHLASSGGDSSNGESLPFFNLDAGNRGLIVAIGWSGDWKTDIEKTRRGFHLQAGMQQTHLRLHPGEEIRTPRIVILPWTAGDRAADAWQDAQNAWRRLLLSKYTPQVNAAPMRGPVLVGTWGAQRITQEQSYVHWLVTHHIPLDVFGVDAGWYGASSGSENDPGHPWWKYRGDWYANPANYPGGLGPLGEQLKAAGIGFSLWMEPETAMPQTRTLKEHTGWYLSIPDATPPGAELLNLGLPAARVGMTKIVSRVLTDAEATWYRQDFNIRPAAYWQKADTADRVGMTETEHIEGLYQLWDALLGEHPGLHIDNCASGGRRIDIETMARSFVVWRTDYGFANPVASQAQTEGLAYWAPETMAFESASVAVPWSRPGPYDTPENIYRMRSGYSAGFGITPGAEGVENRPWLAYVRATLHEYREVQPYLYGDFYPVSPNTLSDTVWSIVQFHRPDRQDGLVLAFRRPGSVSPTDTVSLHGIDPDAIYDLDIRHGLNPQPALTVQGRQLTHLFLQLPHAPSSVLVFYRKHREAAAAPPVP